MAVSACRGWCHWAGDNRSRVGLQGLEGRNENIEGAKKPVGERETELNKPLGTGQSPDPAK
jgi:hypothetical protein